MNMIAIPAIHGRGDERPAVAVFRSTAFNASEGFIQAQACALGRYRPIVTAFRRTPHLRPELAEDALFPWKGQESLALRWLGRAGPPPPALAAVRPVLVHAHFATDGLIALPVARRLGVPLITHLRGYDVSVRRGRMAASGRLSWMRLALFERRLQDEGDLFLAVSEALRRQAIARGYPADRTFTHYNGVDLSRFRPAPERAEPGLVLHIGRLVEKKGTAHLLRAFAEARRRHPAARLVVIGDGPLRASLEKLASELGLGAAVSFLGAQPQEAVRDWMARAWTLAAPSLAGRNGDSEGLPNVVVEALASALPSVAYAHAGIPEAVIDGRTGLLAPEGEAAALAARLAELLAAPDLRGRLAVSARALAESRFDAARQALRLEAHYDRLAGMRAVEPIEPAARVEEVA